MNLTNRGSEQKSYDDSVKVQTDDIVKFGRVRFKVKKIVTAEYYEPSAKLPDFNEPLGHS